MAVSIPELTTALEDPDPNVRIGAARTLASLGPEAQKAVPFLMKALHDPNLGVKVSVAIALIKIDPSMRDAVPILTGAMQREEAVKRLSAEAAGLHGAQADTKEFGLEFARKWEAFKRGELTAEVMPIILKALEEDDRDVRILAVMLLGGLAEKSPEAMRGLTRALRDSDPDIQLQAVMGLKELGRPAVPAIPELSRLLSSEDSRLRFSTARTLMELDSRKDRYLPVFVKILQDQSELDLYRIGAVQTLGEMAPDRKEARAALLDALADSDPTLRSAAADALSRAGSVAITPLLESLKSPNTQSRAGAVRVLGLIGRGRPEVVEALISALQDRERSVRYMAVQALAEIGADAPAAIEALVQALQDREEPIRASAGDALVRIGPAAVPALRTASTTEDPLLRARIERILEKLRSEAKA